MYLKPTKWQINLALDLNSGPLHVQGMMQSLIIWLHNYISTETQISSVEWDIEWKHMALKMYLW